MKRFDLLSCLPVHSGMAAQQIRQVLYLSDHSHLVGISLASNLLSNPYVFCCWPQCFDVLRTPGNLLGTEPDSLMAMHVVRLFGGSPDVDICILNKQEQAALVRMGIVPADISVAPAMGNFALVQEIVTLDNIGRRVELVRNY